ncbi:hypothetical protein WICPIJ_005902 [Wickerhamomyces pijperi]|uniref:Uncharacterized protein n=1 Tax=Wickerhamomyces pijperi TaxID=599730 RepID=A0A9P8TLH1_WICPI|nr:hypothetical protein WICPIJ_005902 [Wickerhamomyces pijperi]
MEAVAAGLSCLFLVIGDRFKVRLEEGTEETSLVAGNKVFVNKVGELLFSLDSDDDFLELVDLALTVCVTFSLAFVDNPPML